MIGKTIAAFLALFLAACWAARSDEVDRSPVDLALVRGGELLVTANQTSGSASLVDARTGRVLDEIAVGERPVAVAVSHDGNRCLVSCSYGGSVALLRIERSTLQLERRIPLAGEPLGAAISPDGKQAYVALTAFDQVAVIDLESAAVLARIPVGRWPRYVALSPDGSRLAVGTSGDRGVSIVNTLERRTEYQEKFVGLNIGHLQCSSDGRHVYFPWMVYRRNPITPLNIQIGWVLASRVARVGLDGPARREAISLDPRGDAIADPHGLALTADERRLVVSASGTHELLVYRLQDLPLQDYGGTDHVPPELLADADRFYRIEVGGRPMGLRIADDSQTVYVANYLLNAVQVVDLKRKALTSAIPLGGPRQPSLARRGEAIFHDGDRSLDGWYSCHTCHYEGGTNSVAMDTLNDGTRFTFKTVQPLYDVRETGPWTWHGWQEDLDDAMSKSFETTMQGEPISIEDRQAVLAYLGALRRPPNPHAAEVSAAAERGRRIFQGERGGCASCHQGPQLTDGAIHDLGLGSSNDRYHGFNTPSLVNVYRKVIYMHDGRAKSLEEVLTGPHAPEKVAGESLSRAELADLIEYLKTL